MRTKYMQYEVGAKRPLVKDKWVAKNVKDINKLSSWRILVYLYRRHEIFLLQLTVAVVFTLAIINKLG